MENELISVKQLPIIIEQLQKVKGQIEQQTENALSLECTADNVKTIKTLRAGLTKDFEILEERRKYVKKAVLEPYENFEIIYKDCVTNLYTKADKKLKDRIDTVENSLKEEKRNNIKRFFDEYIQSKKVDFVSLEDARINVTLSANEKQLKKQVETFVDRIFDDLAFIDTQEHKDEILYYYKKSGGQAFLNAPKAITIVVEKSKAIEEARQKEETKKAELSAQEKPINKALSAPKAEEFMPEADDKVLKLCFTVFGTKNQLRKVKEFLIDGGYRYE